MKIINIILIALAIANVVLAVRNYINGGTVWWYSLGAAVLSFVVGLIGLI